ncbi:MAG: pseudouridine synthase [Betaproteobacteria bacterium]
MLIAFNKPYGVICQFSPSGGKPTLKDFIDVPGVYPAGRLDTDSEGLLLLTDDGILQARIADPARTVVKTYWVQVDGEPTDADVEPLREGLDVGEFVTAPAQARLMAPPANLWPRDPPVRVRQNIPTAWLEIGIAEGKNRQIRRMTARIGYPTLRLLRVSIGSWRLEGIAPGKWRIVDVPAEMMRRVKATKKP